MKKSFLPLFLVCFLCVPVFCQQFKVSYSPRVFNKPFTGKLLVYLNKENRNPKDAMADLESFPCFAVDVINLQPGANVTVNDKAYAYPVKLSDIERGDYYVQAVWDRNLGGRTISASHGNIYSKPVQLQLTKDLNKVFTLVCDQVIPEPVFKETEFVKELKVPSALLSGFHRKSITVDAAVILPAEYFKEPQRRFPVLYLISGFGGDYHYYSGDTVSRSQPLDSVSCITVFLDGNCALGHSVYANSSNNGPWGDALVKEFIPLVESTYRCDGARLLRGHSSGGWTVAYLQTHYPAVFAGCWSSSPDPVDFRDFQRINFYEDNNMYYNKDSVLRSVATVAGRFPWVSMKQCYRQESVIYRGEQMRSFDAVFSERGADGNPLRISDVVTGAISKDVFEHWKSYDISLYLRNNWLSLKNDLEGKMRISVGEQDNFLLNGPVRLLENEMKKLDAKIIFAYYPGDHFTVSTPEYRRAGLQFLAKRYREWKEIQGK